MKKRFYFILFFCLLTGYIIFAPHQLKKELIFIPSWVTGIEEVAASDSASASIPFSFDSSMGYFSADGRILYESGVAYKAAVSEDFFVNYSSVAENLVMQDSRGRILGNIETEGLPFFIGERFFVVSPDRMVLREFDRDGREILRISPGSVITSVDAGDRAVVVGMLNGEVSLYGDDSTSDYTYFSTDSRYSVTYSCSITDDGKRFAVVTGLYPQQLVCFELKNDTYVPVYQQTITEPYRRNVLLDYSNDGRLLYLESKEGLEIYSTATFLRQDLRIAGRVKEIVLPGERDMSFIVSGSAENNHIRVYRADLGRLAEFVFPFGDIYFYQTGNCFYVGLNGKIIRYDIIEG